MELLRMVQDLPKYLLLSNLVTCCKLLANRDRDFGTQIPSFWRKKQASKHKLGPWTVPNRVFYPPMTLLLLPAAFPTSSSFLAAKLNSRTTSKNYLYQGLVKLKILNTIFTVKQSIQFVQFPWRDGLRM